MTLTDEQKKLRMLGIGGSEIAALVGASKYMTPIDVYANKREGRVIEDNEHMERGRFYERPTADWYAYRTGAELREVGTIVHPDQSIVVCTPDFLARTSSSEHDLSIKVPGPRTYREWGESGTDQAPDAYLLQVQWELIPLERLEGISTAVIVAPIDGELRQYPVHADRELQGMLIEAAERFWKDHVVKKIPPPPDASASYSEFLAKKFPKDDGLIVKADNDAETWATVLRHARVDLKAAEEREANARNWLMAAIGSASGIEGNGWRISYKSTKGRPSVDWDAVAEEAGIPKALIEKHTKRHPYRQFRPTFKESK